MQNFGEPFGDEVVHLLGGNLRGGAVQFGGCALHGAVEHAQDELAEQHPVADAHGVKIILHLRVGGVPFLKRASGKLTGNAGQCPGVHGGLHW